jgi:hypothetical protein
MIALAMDKALASSEQEPAPEAAQVERRVARKATGSRSEGLAGLGDELAAQAQTRSAGAIAEAGFSGSAHELPDREYYEKSFGRSFADVRVYTDAAAAKACKDINAEAYTVGNKIAFANPSRAHDRALVAHELTHVTQQSDGPQAKSGSPDADGIERSGEGEAEAVEAAVASGKPARSALEGEPTGKPKAPARKANDAGSRWGAALEFSPEGLKGGASYDLVPATEINIPIGYGFFLFCKPSVTVKAESGLNWAASDFTANLGVEGKILMGVKFGVPSVADAYFGAFGSVGGGFEFKMMPGDARGPWWHLVGELKFETGFEAGVSILNGWGPSPSYVFGKSEVAKLTGIRFDNAGLNTENLGWTWHPVIQDCLNGCQKALKYLARWSPDQVRPY